MKFESINKKFSQTVAEWMGKGYYINTATMSGRQGEVASVDLTDGKEIIRVLLDNFHDMEWDNHHDFVGVQIIVGRAADEVQPNNPSVFCNTLWNNQLEVNSSEKFYEIGKVKRTGQKWYGSKEEAIAQQDKYWERFDNSYEHDRRDLAESAKAIVLPYVERQPKCKGVKLSDIDAVQKIVNHSRFNGTVSVRYEVKAKGKAFVLS